MYHALFVCRHCSAGQKGSPMRTGNIALWTMTAVSFGTGALDAATYLGMDGVFGANMTGNVILTALSIAGEGTHSYLGPLLSLVGFITGSWLFGLITRRYSKSVRPDPVVAPVFTLCAAGMIVVAAVLFWLPLQGSVLHTTTFIIGALMGCQAIAARRVGVPDISTVVVTSTLSLLFAEAGTFRGGATNQATGRRLAAVLSMLLGALSGALLLKIGLVAAMSVPAIILSVVAVIYTILAVKERRQVRDQSEQPAYA